MTSCTRFNRRIAVPPPASRRLQLATAVLILGAPATVMAQPNPNGPQFQISADTTGSQVDPDIASAGPAGFVVVWSSTASEETDSDGFSIHARRLDAAGMPSADQIQVNESTTGDQRFSSVAAGPAGDFVVVWQSPPSEGPAFDQDLRARRFGVDGQALGPEFQVNDYTTGVQTPGDVLVLADGGFVVVWGSEGSAGTDTSENSIQVRRFAADGQTLGLDFQVNQTTLASQVGPKAARDAAGNFVVVWATVDDYLGYPIVLGLSGRRFDSQGAPAGDEFAINSLSIGMGTALDVVQDAEGGTVVAWVASSAPWSGTDIRARKFDAQGEPVTSEFAVTGFDYDYDEQPSLAADARGNFVVAWRGVDPDAGVSAIKMRGYRANATATAPGFLAQEIPGIINGWPDLASDADGNPLLVWSSVLPPKPIPSDWDVQLRRFDALFRDDFETGDSSRWGGSGP